MTATPKISKATKFEWAMLASLALIIPAVILEMRLTFMCPILSLKAFDFLPLFWAGSGCIPHPFCRVMHNLTHPILLVGYAVASGYLAIKPVIGRTLTERFSGFLMWGLLLFHFIFFGAYLITLFLPIKMTEIISKP